MSRNYPRLEIEEFGRHLLNSGDLDPVYIMLSRVFPGCDPSYPAQHEFSQFLVAYWSFYDVGAATHLAQEKPGFFWGRMMTAAINDSPAPTGGRWPRGHERRHFRGAQGIAAVKDMSLRHEQGASSMLKELMHSGPAYHSVLTPIPFSDFAPVVQRHRGFGPWIAFKVGDMLERLGLRKVLFDRAEVFMYKDPREAAIRLWRERSGHIPTAKPKDEARVIEDVVGALGHEFRGFMAPPTGDRPVGLQEIETILCKWKSHMNGHYPLNNDTDEIRRGLAQWNSPLHREMEKALP